MKKEIVGSICLVLGIVIIISSGTSFAYFTAKDSDTNTIKGDSYEFNINLQNEVIYKASNIIPINDSSIAPALTYKNKCRDNRNQDVCSLYKLNLSNNGSGEILNAYVTVDSTTTYQNAPDSLVSNLRMQILDDKLKPLSKIISLPINSNNNYFIDGNSSGNLAISIGPKGLDDKKTYYVVIWLHETNNVQNYDANKVLNGKITFETLNGGKIVADFSS